MCKRVFAVVVLGFWGLGACDLNESECELDTKEGKITLSFEPRPIRPMTQSTLVIKGLKGVKKPRVHIYGLSMYLGHLREDLEPNEKGWLEAGVMLAPCDDEKMVFALEVLDDKEIIAKTEFSTFK